MTKPQITLYSMVKSWKIFSKTWNKTRMPILITFSQHSFRSPSHSNEKKKKFKKLNWKGRSKSSIVCRWPDSINRKSKDTTRKLLELINKWNNISGCKINKHEFVVFLYTNKILWERRIKETISLTIAPKNNKISRNILT